MKARIMMSQGGQIVMVNYRPHVGLGPVPSTIEPDYRWVFGAVRRVEKTSPHIREDRPVVLVDYARIAELIRGNEPTHDNDKASERPSVSPEQKAP